MPYLRSLTARALSAKGLHQARIAEHLGVSQAMVSKYLRAPVRAVRHLEEARVERLVTQAVETTLRNEASGQVAATCPVCDALAGHGVLCATSAADAVDHCVRSSEPVSRSDQAVVVEALKKAEAWIRRADFRPLQPAVRINVAMATPDARDARDVAAFPGRLVELQGKVRSVSPPEFGSSTHLAQLLLRIRKRRPAVRAIMNLRHDQRIRNAARRAELAIRPFARTRGDLNVAVPSSGVFHGFVDPGAFGLEPNLYLVGTGPQEILEHAARLLRHLQSSEGRTAS